MDTVWEQAVSVHAGGDRGLANSTACLSWLGLECPDHEDGNWPM